MNAETFEYRYKSHGSKINRNQLMRSKSNFTNLSIELCRNYQFRDQHICDFYPEMKKKHSELNRRT